MTDISLQKTAETAKRARGRPFPKGQSGNPAGRPRGSSNRATRAAEMLLEGEATALYVQTQLGSTGVAVSRIARGLPVGGDLEYADGVTIAQAISARRAM